eukprot:m.43563 g.43563  ORF g.43563 m.43563 type:complete len:833 (+) comp10795_c0_seq1:96-2594(+)
MVSLKVALLALLCAFALADTEGSCPAGAASCATAKESDPCVPHAPPKRVVKPVLHAPGEEPRVYNSALKLEVLIRAPVGNEQEDFDRLLRSATVQGLHVTVLPSGAKYGTAALQTALEARKGDNNTVLLFLNDAAALALATEKEILRTFQDLNASIVFAAERRCRNFCGQKWPVFDGPAQSAYMHTDAFIGYAPSVAELLDLVVPPPNAKLHVPEQNVLIGIYLSTDGANKLGLKLDVDSKLFQALYGWKDDISYGDFALDLDNESRVFNTQTENFPGLLLAAGNRKLLDQLGNYVPYAYTEEEGCIVCRERVSCVSATAPPLVHTSIFVDDASPFLDLFLDSLSTWAYNKSHLDLHFVLFKGAPKFDQHNQSVAAFLANHSGIYHNLTVAYADTLFAARHTAIVAARAAAADYAFLITSLFRITRNDTIEFLIKQNRTVIAPMMTRYGKTWSNFWGAVDGDFDAQCFDNSPTCGAWAMVGECENNTEWMAANCEQACGNCSAAGPAIISTYRRAWDYLWQAERNIVGVFAVPLISDGLLLARPAIETAYNAFTRIAAGQDVGSKLVREEERAFFVTMQLSQELRRAGHHLHISNQRVSGSVIDPTDYDETKIHPELYLLANNIDHWAATYLHDNYSHYEDIGFVRPECYDIYNFPLFNQRFCTQFVQQAEAHGGWSGASKEGGAPIYDERLTGGYEPVPTQDIHFNQRGFDFEATWKLILKFFVAPVAEHKFLGYTLDGRNTLDFIVKYTPQGQPFLRPHHDASTFSLNVALNQIGIDFQGGGTHFLRQNCTVLTNKVGHALIHPGRLTHYHEGLYVSEGVRYILVSFVDQ